MANIRIGNYTVPKRYVPVGLTAHDSLLQKKYLTRSRKAYLKHKYINRPKVKSFTSKKSSHVYRATQIYGVENMQPNNVLARATGCKKWALKKIINKGEGAYYSSGSRPNQTAQSWGYARLASALTGGPSSQIDYDILKKGCSKKSHPVILANKTRKTYKK
jgi:hypothetical protein